MDYLQKTTIGVYVNIDKVIKKGGGTKNDKHQKNERKKSASILANHSHGLGNDTKPSLCRRKDT